MKYLILFCSTFLLILLINKNEHHSSTLHFHQNHSCGLEPAWTDNPPKPIRSKFHKYIKNQDGSSTIFPFKTCSPASDITVTYNGFPADAITAFEFAVGIWEQYIVTDDPIHVNAFWANFGGNGLGFAGPQLTVNFSGAPITNTWYPMALVNDITNSNANGGVEEIFAQFDGARSNWYFGTDGNTPISDYDFVTVVLHELGHGLGFLGSSSYNPTDSSTYKLPFDGFPIVYTTLVENSSGQKLTSFVEGSTELSSQLIGNDLFLGGTNVTLANSGNDPKIYAPINWAQGSSEGHLDETTFEGTPNALMTPSLFNGEAIHDPGAIVLGLYKDIGYTISSCGQSNGDCTDNEDITIPSGTITTDQTVKTSGDALSNDAMSTVTINNDAKVFWQSKDNIQLNPVFSVETGSELDLNIDDCEGNN